MFGLWTEDLLLRLALVGHLAGVTVAYWVAQCLFSPRSIAVLAVPIVGQAVAVGWAARRRARDGRKAKWQATAAGWLGALAAVLLSFLLFTTLLSTVCPLIPQGPRRFY